MLEMFGLGKQTINVKDVSYLNISGVTEVVLRADELYSPFVEDELSKCSPTVLLLLLLLLGRPKAGNH